MRLLWAVAMGMMVTPAVAQTSIAEHFDGPPSGYVLRNGQVEGAPTPPVSSRQAQADTFLADYISCLLETAAELEVSGEAAEAVADATVAACATGVMGASMGQVLVGVPSAQAEAEIIKTGRGSALLRVVRIRACRKTVGCTLPGASIAAK